LFKDLKIKTEILTSTNKMYEELNCFEEALKHFGTRVDVIIAMEMSRKISPEESYQRIKDELKEVKKCRKLYKKNDGKCLEEKSEHYWQPDRNKTYDEMVTDGWTMSADGFWIKEF